MGRATHQPHISASECLTHGCIVFGDGSKSGEFYTFADAEEEIQNGLLSRRITESQADLLRKWVAHLRLLTEAEIAVLEYQEAAIRWVVHGDGLLSPPAQPDLRMLH